MGYSHSHIHFAIPKALLFQLGKLTSVSPELKWKANNNNGKKGKRKKKSKEKEEEEPKKNSIGRIFSSCSFPFVLFLPFRRYIFR